MKILIVDDHEIVRLGLKRILSKWDVIEADNSDVAVQLVAKMQPDVSLIATHLRSDGMNCLAKIMLRFPAANVVMFGSEDLPAEVVRAVALGARGFLLKSSTAEEILTALSRAHLGENIWNFDMLRRSSAALLAPRHDHSLFTGRESDVLKGVASGLSNKEIAETLSIGPGTIKSHLKHIMRKLSLSDRTQVAVWAVKNQVE